MTESIHDYQEREAEEGRRELRREQAERFLDLNAKSVEHAQNLRDIFNRITKAIRKGKTENEHD